MLIIMSNINNIDFCLKQDLQDTILYILFHLSGGCLFSPLSGQHLQYNTHQISYPYHLFYYMPFCGPIKLKALFSLTM